MTIHRLCFSSFVGFVLLFALNVPIYEWAGAFVCRLLSPWAGLPYRRGLQSVGAAFPAALFVLALMTKLVASIVRYWTIVSLYHRSGDAFVYYNEALRLLPDLLNARLFGDEMVFLSGRAVRPMWSTSRQCCIVSCRLVLPGVSSCLRRWPLQAACCSIWRPVWLYLASQSMCIFG